MKFIENIYFGNSAYNSRKKILRDLKRKKYLPGVCLVTLPTNSNNLLDIFEAYSLLQNVPTEDLTVVGITYGKEEALELVRQIVDETYSKFGTVDIIKFLGL